MLFVILLALAAALLAFANGANDNFKDVATLFGGGLTSYRPALAWATATTLAGSLASVILAQGVLHKFSGMGLVPAALTGSGGFALAVALGARVGAALYEQKARELVTEVPLAGDYKGWKLSSP